MDTGICKKCSAETIILYPETEQLCKNCFIYKVVHKFKAYFSRQKLSLYNHNILVILSGNIASFALLHLLKESMDGGEQNKCNVNCLYIEEGLSTEKTPTVQQKIIDILAKESEELSFKSYIGALSKFFCNKDNFIQPLDSTKLRENVHDSKVLEIFLNNLGDNTSKQDLLFRLRNKLIISAAKQFNSTLVLLDDIASDLATEIISNMVLGQGVNNFFKNYATNKKHVSKFLYPLQNFTQNEITTYLEIKNCAHILLEFTNLNKLEKPSIQNITKKFILKLDNNKIDNLTTSTICKLSEKINNHDLDLSSKYCTLCHKQIVTVHDSQKVSTDYAKNISEYISKIGKDSEYCMYNRHSNESEGNLDIIDYRHFESEAESINICYSCGVLLHKCKNLDVCTSN